MSEIRLEDLLDALARDQGDPGGGTASGVVTAIAASLAQMVCRYSDPDRTGDIDRRLGDLRARVLDAAADDGHASGALGAALRPAEDGTAARGRRIVDAASRAVATSAALGGLALEVWDELRGVIEIGNRHLMSDAAVAADAVAAGLGGAATNLRGGFALLAAHGDAAPLQGRYGDLVDRLLSARRDAREAADRLGEA
ncbi:cyclodeaminase/cyclohydrolase family protein [Microbacterium radiodurans]|uniref:Cyclodeaminase/cyclohydrolase family protein n=1 Tax=Microbacterium radiodurans TaxID=661398 RepID=A0A5J5IR94_9MICO|nr:cyclodeaminase/cyclohydrolase family protein [Microbacterium radiodurans]KAA9087166.1 cyclodeaminase/cyclohydrolase family protein [Microbacterium radiodurans]